MADHQAPSPLVRQLRWALHHLYDPGELRKSPLVALFGLDMQEGAPALRRILLEAIEALKPRPNVPPQAKGWRIYRALYHRYGEQFAPREVAKALGLSIRQLRRQESVALQVLADYLTSRYGLDPAGLGPEPAPPFAEDEETPSEAPSREQELKWLEKSLPSEAVALSEVIPAVLKVAGPLSQALAVSVETALPEPLPRLAVPSGTLRQALLNTLTAAIRAAPGGKVSIGAEAGCGQVRICIRPVAGGATQRTASDYAESLKMATQLLALSGGSLSVEASEEDRPFTARLTLPTAEQAAVLVIDDNADTLQLFQRYLNGTRYPFVGTRDPAQALVLACEVKPQIVVLDVMLPGVDGWELLGRLREDPATHGIPVVVCTILPEEDLALVLGAAAFLRKPVSRTDFLAALQRVHDLRR